MSKTDCPLCRARRARRSCPALGHQICAVCCGTKRRIEIDCPADCTYLQSASAHPPAVVQRQQERDVRYLLALLHGLSERQHQVVFLLQTLLRAERPDAPALTDTDIRQAAEALAATYETASRGIVYEHAATSGSAQRLAVELRQAIEARQSDGVKLSDVDLASALRRIETGAREAARALGDDGRDTAYLSLLRRILKDPGRAATPAAGAEQGGETDPGSRLIVPAR